MSRSRKARKDAQKKPAAVRTATRVLIVIGISTAVFVILNYISFLLTGVEQVVMIQWYFRGIVIELGAMMGKRITEVIVKGKGGSGDAGVPDPEDYEGMKGEDFDEFGD